MKMSLIQKKIPLILVGFACFVFQISSPAESEENKHARKALPFYGAKNLSMLIGQSIAQENNSVSSVEIPKELGRILSTCGATNDWHDVELYGGLTPSKTYVDIHQPPVVQLQWIDQFPNKIDGKEIAPGNVAGEPWCTGTLIDHDKILTAAHCFEPQNEPQGWETPSYLNINQNKQDQLLPAESLARLFKVNFRYQVNGNDPGQAVRSPDVFFVEELLEYGFNDNAAKLDYAIFRVGKNSDRQLPSHTYSIAKMDTSKLAVTRAKKLTLIQHPHGLPKKIMSGPKAGIVGVKLLYENLDTLGGSSGAGVLNEEGKIIAVHIQGGCTKIGGANRGVLLSKIKSVSDIID